MQKCDRCKADLDGWTVNVYDSKGNIKENICYVCDRVDSVNEYKKSGIIATRLMTQAVMARIHFERDDLNSLRAEVANFERSNRDTLLEIASATDEIEKLVRKFEEDHWLRYIKKYWNKSDDRGHHFTLPSKAVAMMWGSAGRVLITLENKKADISMIFLDEESQLTPNGGIQGINATKDQAIALLTEAINMKKIDFTPKKSVTMAGL